MNRALPALLLLLTLPALADDAGPREDRDAGAEPPSLSGIVDRPDGGTAGAMTEVLDEALKKIAQARNQEARRMLKKKDYPGALSRFREAHDLDPANAEITNNLGYIYYLLGNHEEAERLYRATIKLDPARFVAYLNLADLLVLRGTGPERTAEAAELLVRARELMGNRPKLILRQARVAVLVGAFLEAERFYMEYLGLRKPTDALRLEIGDFYRDLGRTEEALDWYRQIDDEELGRQAAGRIWEIEVEKQTRRFGWTHAAGAVPAKARMLASRGRVALNRRDYAEAERLLGEALTLAPWFAMARADLGDVLRRTDRAAAAELQYLRALAVDNSNAEVHARLGELYLEAPRSEGRAGEAALFLGRALDLRPDWAELHLTLARALRAAGDLPGALRHVDRYLAGVARVEDRGQALALKREIEELIGPSAEQPQAPEDALVPALGTDLSEELAEALGRARARLARGETDAAMAELRRLSDAERGPPVLNLEARILLGAGRLDEAAETLRASLRRAEEQGVVHEQLGTILLRLGKRTAGLVHLRRAEELGETNATYHLARVAIGDEPAGALSWVRDATRIGDLIGARGRIDRFLERGSSSLYRSEARALRQRVGERLTALVIAAVSLLVLLVSVATVVSVRIWGGCDLQTLIEEHPETGPDVQRVLSAVRHEVLKHNTMMLSGLVDALEKDEDAAAKALHLKTSLLGAAGKGGVARRLANYVSQLQKIGRSAGRRLNLKRKDAAISPLLKGFALIERAAAGLSRLRTLSAGRRSALLRLLKNATRLLNVEGYEAVRDLLDRLRILTVDRGLLLSIYDRCCNEPSYVRTTFAPLDLELRLDAPSGVTIPRPAFEDILANLLRNAIQSSLEQGTGQVEIGLGVELEVDPITGLERIVFLVRDRSRKVLTAEMLRGRYIEEGLGLTADLVSRYDGTLDVRPGTDGWSKAVVVKLPRAELGETDADRRLP